MFADTGTKFPFLGPSIFGSSTSAILHGRAVSPLHDSTQKLLHDQQRQLKLQSELLGGNDFHKISQYRKVDVFTTMRKYARRYCLCRKEMKNCEMIVEQKGSELGEVRVNEVANNADKGAEIGAEWL